MKKIIWIKANLVINEGTGWTGHTSDTGMQSVLSALWRQRGDKRANQTPAFPSWLPAERQLTWRSRCELVGSLQSCWEPNLSSEGSRRWRIRALTVQPKELKPPQGDGCTSNLWNIISEITATFLLLHRLINTWSCSFMIKMPVKSQCAKLSQTSALGLSDDVQKPRASLRR